MISKGKGSCYVPGRRTGASVKYKLNQCQEFVIGGYSRGIPFEALIADCYEGSPWASGESTATAMRRTGTVPDFQEIDSAFRLRYESASTYNRGLMATLLRIFLSTLTFLVAFYGTTVVMSFLYPLDTAILAF